MLKKTFIFKILFGVFSIIPLVTACSNNAQNQFLRDAEQTPSGYTHTDVSGKILSKDPNDWRIGPMFQGFIEVTQPPYPNPASTNQEITLELNINGLQAIYGLYVYTNLNQSAGVNQAKLIYQDPSAPLSPGLITIKINPIVFSPTGVASDASGLHRIFIYDSRNNLITYGDIMIQ